MRIHQALRGLLVLGCLSLVSCGESDDETCPGTLCTNCATDCGEVNITCGSGQVPACVGLEFFTGVPSDGRCVFCTSD
ncbi:MAG: hypothetical protein JRG93_10380 [Deltaproteobacteria bacterium]|nr:hypothetical protein [Deltaproteobacteria bacterium]MBW2222760.1 hypothetical protein [Deltaproteobacteria bacterium]MBW2402372.1 hypothetical protein [Deltaproteobacteria bacterium]MBW2546335.1 hypothetical protein [Deltaproteobacteria bacterium]MBW2717379.1 hypothetical protein [Deltaproteobacteria bacterium]